MQVMIPRFSWKTPIAELDKDPANWRTADLSEEAIAEYVRVWGADKVRAADPRVHAQAKAVAAAKRATAAKAAAEEAIRQSKAAEAELAKANADLGGAK